MMFGIGAGEAYVFGEDNVLDISDWTTPYTLEYLTGIKVYNLGVSGGNIERDSTSSRWNKNVC